MFSKRMPDAKPEEQAKFESLVASAIGEIFTNYPIDDVLRDMVPIYQNHLSESDLNQIVAFYSSPIGQKVLKEMPAMSAEAMRVSYARLQPKIEGLMKNLDLRLQEMADEENGAGKSKGAATPNRSHPQN